jgi:gentisate 1,2-dioxygenase
MRSTIDTPSGSWTKPHVAFYRDLNEHHLGALWNVLSSTLTREPVVRSVSQLWRWRELRPRMRQSGDLVTAAEAERRVLYLINPGLDIPYVAE